MGMEGEGGKSHAFIIGIWKWDYMITSTHRVHTIYTIVKSAYKLLDSLIGTIRYNKEIEKEREKRNQKRSSDRSIQIH